MAERQSPPRSLIQEHRERELARQIDTMPLPRAPPRSDQLTLRKQPYGDDPYGYFDITTLEANRQRKAQNEFAMLEHEQQLQPPPPHPSQFFSTPIRGTAVGVMGYHDEHGIGPLRLTKKEKAFLIRKAKESSLALIEHAHTLDGPVQWHYKGKHHGIQMYRGEGVVEGDEEHPLEFLCGVTTMMGTLEEVSEYFDQCTTARMRVKKADDVMDCAVVYSLVTGNTVNPFHRVTVKYSAYEGPVALTSRRDFCYLECQDTFRHSSGRRGWVLSMHSVKLPNCPEVPGFVRASMYHSGFVFVESERPGYMDVMHSLQINFKGKNRLPQFILNTGLKRRLRELIRISREIQVARVAHHTLLKKQDLMPKNLRTTCVNCCRRFWLLIRKTRCRVCGEVVCQACAPQIEVIDAEGHGPIKTRICVRCCGSAPSTGSWSAQPGPWTEESHMREYQRPARRDITTMRHVKDTRIHDDDHDETNQDGEGRYTFAELEEQSSHSVFAPERFTRSSMASMAGTPLHVDQIGVDYEEDDNGSVRSSEFRWQPRATDDSLFDNMGSLSGSVMSRDSYFGREDVPIRMSRRPLLDEAPALVEEPDVDQITHVNRPSQRKPRYSLTSAKMTNSYDYLDSLIDLPVPKGERLTGVPTRKRAQTVVRSASVATTARDLSQLNSSTLCAHNLRYMQEVEQSSKVRVSQADESEMTADDEASEMKGFNYNCVPSDSFDTNVGSVDRDNSLFTRPSSLILQQVRKNRSRTILLQSDDQYRTTEMIKDMEATHRRRMAELNQKAIEYAGTRVSGLEARPSLTPAPVEDEVWRNSTAMEEYRSRRKHTIEALRKKAQSIQEDGRESSGTDHTAASSSRSPSFANQKLTSAPSESPLFVNQKMMGTPSEHMPSVDMDDLMFKPSIIGSRETMLNQGPSVRETLPSQPERPSADAVAVLEDDDDTDEEIELVDTYEPQHEPEMYEEKSPELKALRREYVSVRSLYEEIGQLTRLQSEMAIVSDVSEQERIKDQIRDQYQLIRQLKLHH